MRDENKNMLLIINDHYDVLVGCIYITVLTSSI